MFSERAILTSKCKFVGIRNKTKQQQQQHTNGDDNNSTWLDSFADDEFIISIVSN